MFKDAALIIRFTKPARADDTARMEQVDSISPVVQGQEPTWSLRFFLRRQFCDLADGN